MPTLFYCTKSSLVPPHIMLDRKQENRQGYDSDEDHLLQNLKPASQDARHDVGTHVVLDHDKNKPSTGEQAKRQLLRPVGIKTSWVAIIAASWAVLLIAISLLIFLWQQSHHNIGGRAVSGTWETLRDPSRLFITLTVSAMVLRTTVAAQTGILTAILASLLLRRYLVPLEEAPGMLMMRATRSFGPGNILDSLGYKQYWGTLEFLIAGALWLAALGMQTTSTLLASDLGWAVVPLPPRVANSSFDFSLENEPVVTSQFELLGQALYNGNQPGEGSEPWLSRMASYPTFGEYSEPPSVGVDFVDTGLTMRAFLPFASTQQRESLLEFEGPTRILEAQVVCVRPVVDANITLRYVGMAVLPLRGSTKPESSADGYKISDFDKEDLEDLEGGSLSVSGLFSWNKTLSTLDLPHGLFRAERGSECAIPKAAPNSTETPFSLCILDMEENLARTSSMSGVRPMLNPEGRDADNPESWIPPVFIVVGGATNPDLWKGYMMSGDFGYAPKSGVRFRKDFKPLSIKDNSGPWATIGLPSSDQELRVSLCFASNTVGARYVSLKAEVPRAAEPTWTWDKTTGQWNFSSLAALLGATAVGPGRPLKLEPLANWTEANIPDQRKTLWKCDDGKSATLAACFDRQNMTSTGIWRHWEFEPAATFARIDSVYLCSQCGANGGMRRAEASASPLVDAPDTAYRPHRAHAALFQSMMKATGGNLAVSLQALFTTLFQAVYYEYLPSLTMSAPATSVFGASMRIPVRWTGLGIVLALLVVYFVASALLLGVCLCGASEGDPFIGETWQAIAQSGQGSAVEEIAAALGQRTDKDIKDCLRSDHLLVGLGKSESGLPVLRRRMRSAKYP